jgi:hypothetical protein
VRFVYWVFEDKHCFRFPHNAGYVGVSEDPENRWRNVRVVKKAPKARLVILYEGTREECLRREYQLRPGLRIGCLRPNPEPHDSGLEDGCPLAAT